MKRKLYNEIKIESFRQLLDLYKNKYKDDIAFEFRDDPNSMDFTKITYEQFAKDVEALGASLLKHKVKRVALISPNRYEWCVSYLAITTAGLVAVPLDKSLPGNEIEGLFERSKADAIIYAKKYEDSVSKCKVKICMDDNSYTNLLEEGYKISHDDYDNVEVDTNSMSIMLFTSGTTSIAKAVMLSQHSICHNLTSYSMIYRVPRQSKYLSFLPLHHTFESTITFLYGTSIGLCICFCDGLKYISKDLVDYQIDSFVCVPLMLEIMYKKIIKNIKAEGKEEVVNRMRKLFRHAPIAIRRKVFKQIIDGLGGHLRYIVSGGAPMDRETLQGYSDFGIDIVQGYGLTETCAGIIIENKKSKRVGSIGVGFTNNEYAIDNPDKDGIGELKIKSESVMLGYYENDDLTKEVIKDGWFYTGDLGYQDKDGFFFITGRKKDMIVLKNGKKIFPEELEILINKLPYVSESMVFGHVDDTKKDRNEDVVLYAKIVYDKNNIKKYFPDEKDYHDVIFEDIKNKINKQMPAYKYIRKILVTDLPLIKTTTQKIKRNDEMKLIESEIKEQNQ